MTQAQMKINEDEATGTEVLVLEKLTAVDLFDKPDTLDKLLVQIRHKALTEPQDLTTDKGRKAIASLAHKVSRSKTFLQDKADEHMAEAKKKIAFTTAEKKRVGEFCDSLRDEVRQPLTEWEAKKKADDEIETKRIDTIKRSLQAVTDYHILPLGTTSEQIKARLAKMEEATTLNWAEFEQDYLAAKDNTITKLTEQLAVVEKAEDDARELEALRKKQAPVVEKLEEAQAVKDMLDASYSEDEPTHVGVTSPKPEESAQIAAIAPDGSTVAADVHLSQSTTEIKQNETKPLQSEGDVVEHKRTVNRAVIAALETAGTISNDQAKAILMAIVKGTIPNVTIEY